MEGYVQNRLTVDDILGPVDSTITVSGDFFTYTVGTVGEVAEQARQRVKASGDSTVFIRSISPKEFLLEIVSIFTKNTPYSGNVRLNDPPALGSLNIYFLSSDPERLVTYFTNNCAYIGWGNAIICDGNFVKKQLDSLTKLDEFYNIANTLVSGKLRW